MAFAETLRDLLTVHAQAITISNIQKVVAEYFQLRVADMLSKRRSGTRLRGLARWHVPGQGTDRTQSPRD